MTETKPLLEARGIEKHFGGVTALTDVSLAVHPAEVVALVGDNGAGKSTLMKIISGIQPPDAGEIRLKGVRHVLKTPTDAQSRGVQTVYQDLALCDNLDTIQNLFLGRELRGPWFLGRRLARAAMEGQAREVLADLKVRLPSPSVPVGLLSGGQRQSVAISRAVLSDPQIVLLDEPTAALGVAQRQEVLALIDRLRTQGRGVIVVTHDLGEVQRVADRIVVLRLGRVVAELNKDEFDHEALFAAITGSRGMLPGQDFSEATDG